MSQQQGQQPDVAEIFKNAWAFDRAAQTLSRIGRESLEAGKPPLDVLPTVVNSVLALELYLKALGVECGLPIQKTHQLRALFDRLPHDVKIKIRAYAYCICNNNPHFKRILDAHNQDFDTALNDASNAFVEFRYAYEGNANNFLVDHIKWAAMQTLVSMRQDLKSLAT